jgi:VanZ family protein
MIKKNIFSILVALVILYLSLASSDTFDEVPLFNIPYLDKIVHIGMYFGLMMVIIFEHRKSLENNKQLFITALIPFSYGILMELLQGSVTSTRSADFYDVISNTSGILISVLLWIWVKPLMKEKIR